MSVQQASYPTFEYTCDMCGRKMVTHSEDKPPLWGVAYETFGPFKTLVGVPGSQTSYNVSGPHHFCSDCWLKLVSYVFESRYGKNPGWGEKKPEVQK